MSRNPNFTGVEKSYIFEIHGEIEVEAYSEEDAEYQLRENLVELINDAIRDGRIDVE